MRSAAKLVLGALALSGAAAFPGSMAAGAAAAPGATAAAAAAPYPPPPGPRTIAVTPPGVDPNGTSGDPSFGGDSGFLVFASQATNLGPDVGTKRVSNIYAFEISTRSVALISAGQDGPANGPSSTPSMSSNGQVVAFASRATNLTSGTPKPRGDVFVRIGGAPARLVSVGFGGVQPDDDSSQPVVSADGRFVAFTSGADNLIAGDDNAATDVFVADLSTGSIRRADVSSSGAQANGDSYNPSISADGSLVCFTSDATNLVPHDRNRVADVFVHDFATGTTKRVSVSSRGREQNHAIPAPFTEVADLSADGSHVVFDSNATNLASGDNTGHTNVFERDLAAGQTTMISRSSVGTAADNDSFAPATTADGGLTVFESFADTLASPWTPNENVFLRDGVSGTTAMLDVTPSGRARGPEVDAQLLQQAAISPSGALVAFASGADNLAGGIHNGLDNLYVRAVAPPATTMVMAPPARTADRRPRVEVGSNAGISGTGLCVLDNRRRACPVGRPFRLPRLRRGPHVLVAHAAAPGTRFDPVGVTVRFTET